MSYYGQPILKPPTWRHFIPAYFFAGGLAGASATLAFAARRQGNDALARTMLLGAAGAVVASTYCLIADLGRPERFVNMLRVVKPTSPMSMGTYIFSFFGACVTAAAFSELTGKMRPVGRAAEGAAAALGPVLATYTAVLIGDTAVPAWHQGRLMMPLVFASTAATSAGAWGLMFAPARACGPARRIAIAGGIAEIMALERLHAELGSFLSETYRTRQAGALSQTARLLTIAGAACATVARNSRAVRATAGVLLFAGGICERFAIFEAGRISTQDPKYVVEPQRKRA